MNSRFRRFARWMGKRQAHLLWLLLAFMILVPRRANGQFDWGAVVAAIQAIGSAINTVIGGGLQGTNAGLGTANTQLNSINGFFQNDVYPQQSIARAQTVAVSVQAIYNAMRGMVNLNVASATLANPQQLESVLLSRNPTNVGLVSGQYTTLYQPTPAPTDAPQQLRDLIDMTDATSQAAMKKAIAIDAAADQLMNASDQLAAELAQTAPGTAPMIEAQSAAMLVKAHALTQSAMAELFRVRAIGMGNASAGLKLNAGYASDTRQNVTNMFNK